MFDFTFSFLCRLALLSARTQADLACRQSAAKPLLPTCQKFPLFCIIYFFLFSASSSLFAEWCPVWVCSPALRAMHHMIDPYLVRKIPIATSNKNNSSLLMRQPWGCGTTHTHMWVKTKWSNCSTTHSSFQFNEHLCSQQQGTCVYSGNNKFGNPDLHWGRV